ncbi:MAG TPA: phospholipase D family protein [Tepidisphaeraceae bacterium]|nr:phospholipase D family protein [Tepidisphaeraceae bacterium]
MIVLPVSLAAGYAAKEASLKPAAAQDGVSVFFSPNGGCTEAIVQGIASAKREIAVQAYYFTSSKIAKALGEARQRGVKVVVILDKSIDESKYSSADYCLNHGIECYVDAQHEVAHNKIILIDGRLIFTGSFNFTTRAEEDNAENLVVIENKPKLQAAYEKNFKEHLGHSKRYEGRKGPASEKTGREEKEKE